MQCTMRTPATHGRKPADSPLHIFFLRVIGFDEIRAHDRKAPRGCSVLVFLSRARALSLSRTNSAHSHPLTHAHTHNHTISDLTNCCACVQQESFNNILAEYSGEGGVEQKMDEETKKEVNLFYRKLAKAADAAKNLSVSYTKLCVETPTSFNCFWFLPLD